MGGGMRTMVENTTIFFLLFHLICYIRPSFSLSLQILVVTQVQGHIAGSSLPSPLRFLPSLNFYREKSSALSSLVGSRRFVPTHARHSQQLILFYFCK